MLEWASLRGRQDVREANGYSSHGGAAELQPPKKSGISLALGGGAARGGLISACCASCSPTRPASR